MKFSVSSALFTNRLLTLMHVMANKNALQILDCILFELKDGKFKMTASDSETTMVSTLEVADAEGEGCFALKPATVVNGLREVSDQPITVEVNQETYEILINYQNGHFNFVGQSGQDYPLNQPLGNEGVQQVSVDAQVLLAGVSRALFATAEDELRPVMNGIFFDVATDSITFVASDGHKLVRDRALAAHGDQPTSFILPKKPAKSLKEILAKTSGEAVIRFDARNAQVELEDYVLSCRLIDGRYPNYNSVIPTDNPYHVTVDRAALISALRRVNVFSSSATSLIRLHIESGDLTLLTQDVDYSTSAEEHIMCDYAGTPLKIGFKGTFLIDILSSISSQEVVLQLADPSRAGVIVPAQQEENEDLLMLLMPMILND